jgi:hypothetical protein
VGVEVVDGFLKEGGIVEKMAKTSITVVTKEATDFAIDTAIAGVSGKVLVVNTEICIPFADGAKAALLLVEVEIVLLLHAIALRQAKPAVRRKALPVDFTTNLSPPNNRNWTALAANSSPTDPVDLAEKMLLRTVLGKRFGLGGKLTPPPLLIILCASRMNIHGTAASAYRPTLLLVNPRELVLSVAIQVHRPRGSFDGAATNPSAAVFDDLGGTTLTAGGVPGLFVDIGQAVTVEIDGAGFAWVSESTAPILSARIFATLDDGGGATTITRPTLILDQKGSESVAVSGGGGIFNLPFESIDLGITIGVELGVCVSTAPILSVLETANLCDLSETTTITNPGPAGGVN